MSAPIDVFLLEEGDSNSGFRTKNAPGDEARRVLVDRGQSMVLRAALVSVTHGDFTPDKDAASLLIFEFNFLARGGRRFTSADITLTFHDESGNVKNRPEVWAIAPEGHHSINKTVSVKDVKQGFNAGLSGGAAGVGAELGYVWETNQTKSTEHATTLKGVKRLLEVDWGRDNSVVWSLEEDHKKKQGIPSFLRAAVLLRRRDDVPFSFTIAVDSGADAGGKFRRLLGREKPDTVDPVQLDEQTDLEDLGIATLNPDTVDLTTMKDLDLAKHADVVLATPLDLPG
jgi:hypothetical protein